MRVKVKVKHMVITFLAIASFLFAFLIFVQPNVDVLSLEKQVSNENTEKTKAEIIELLKKDHSEKYKLIREYIIAPYPERSRYDVYIGSSMSTWSSRNEERLFTLDESEPYLRMYVKEGPIDGYLGRAVSMLTTHYESNGKMKEVEKVIEEGMNRFPKHSFHNHELKLMLIDTTIRSASYEKAEELITELQNSIDDKFTDTYLRLSKLIAEKMVQEGNYEEAYDYIQQEVEKFKGWNDKLNAELDEEDGFEEALSGSPYFNDLVRIQTSLGVLVDHPGSLAKVKGKVVKSNGEPLQNVGVFLREKGEVNHSIIEGETMVVTGADGSFSFTGVFPGSYQIHVGFMFEQIDGWSWSVENDDWIDVSIDDTVEYPIVLTPLIELIEPTNYTAIRDDEITFEWEPFPNAASYELHGTLIFEGGSIGTPVMSGITNHKVMIPVEDLYNLRTGFLSTGDDLTDVEPGSILGFANTEGTFSWGIRAYDEDGRLIGQSDGHRLQEETMGLLPFFHLKHRELTDADRLFLNNRDVKAALKVYKENVENDPDDLHSLRMVTRLMSVNKDKSTDSLKYWLALAEKAPNSDTLFEVAHHYYEKENWSEFERWYYEYLKTTASFDAQSYTKSIYATALMRQGKLEEARSQFYEVMERDRSNRFVGYLLAIEMYLGEDWNEVEQLASVYKERGYDATDWQQIIRQLQVEEDEVLVRKALELYFSGDKNNLDKLIAQNNKSSLTKFMIKLEQIR